jgi:hypothetical protein
MLDENRKQTRINIIHHQATLHNIVFKRGQQCFIQPNDGCCWTKLITECCKNFAELVVLTTKILGEREGGLFAKKISGHHIFHYLLG